LDNLGKYTKCCWLYVKPDIEGNQGCFDVSNGIKTKLEVKENIIHQELSLKCKNCDTVYQLRNFKDHVDCIQDKRQRASMVSKDIRTSKKVLEPLKQKIIDFCKTENVDNVYVVSLLGSMIVEVEKKNLKKYFDAAINIGENAFET